MLLQLPDHLLTGICLHLAAPPAHRDGDSPAVPPPVASPLATAATCSGASGSGSSPYCTPTCCPASGSSGGGNRNLAAVRLTCRALRRPATEAALALALKRTASTQLACFPYLAELDLAEAADFSESWLAAAATHAPHLRALKLGRGQAQALTPAGARAVARGFPRLLRLDLSGCSLRDGSLADALGGLSCLRECDLSMSFQLGDATLAALAAGCPLLERLNLTGCERFSEAGLRALSRLPLRALILSACCQLTDGCLLAIARGLPQLECLGLFEAGEGVTDEGLAHLAALGGSLTALDLGYSCWSHSEAGLAALLARMRRLRMLNIGGCEGATDAVVATVARCCSELRELDVSECQRMSAAAVRQLGQLPCLQELSLGWNIRLQDEALAALPPTLSRLDLSFCGELTDAGLAHVARLPRLSALVLRKCGRLSDGGLLRALGGATALTHLDLSYCATISSAGLAALRPLRRLASVVLVDCLRATSPPALALLAQLPAVSALDLSDNKRLDDGSMQALSHAPRLASLALNNCLKVSDRGLQALCRCASLRTLSVDRCPQLSGAALHTLRRKLPLLSIARPAGGHAPMPPGAAEY